MTRIIQRHDTAANWSTINPVLALGEMGVETDTNQFKLGDGATSYNELPYAAVKSSTVRNIVQISQTDYDALGTKDSNTLYIIV